MYRWIGKAVLVGLMAVGSVQAATFRGNAEVCAAITVTAYDAAQMRDAGIPWEVFGPWIADRITQVKGDPLSYIQDDEDAMYMMNLFKFIWDNPMVEAAELISMVEADCMKAPVSYKKGKNIT